MTETITCTVFDLKTYKEVYQSQDQNKADIVCFKMNNKTGTRRYMVTTIKAYK